VNKIVIRSLILCCKN